MNRRSILKFLAALPFAGLLAPKVVLAANPEIEWRYQMFDYDCHLGVCGIVLFDDPKYGLRMKRAGARFMIPAKAFLDKVRPTTADEMAAAFPDLLRDSKLAVIEQFRTNGPGVVYDDETLVGNEVRIGSFPPEDRESFNAQ